MVAKSRLQAALLNDKGVDFKKLKQKKLAKLAQKGKKSDNKADEWEDVDEEMEDEDEEEDDSEEEGAAKLDLAAIDDSDSDSSNDGGAEGEDDEEEDEEDVPLSDLEDLDDEEKEDLIPHQRLTINNTAALTSALKRISLPLSKWEFSEHQSITTTEPVTITDVSDDLNRELAFYAQSLSAVKNGRALLKAEGAPFSRPKDYFAEMVKADEHMEKIKKKLIDEAAGKKAAAEARKQRDLKKFGKQVQVAKIQEREKEKKQTLDKIKTLKRKRQDTGGPTDATEADLFDVGLEDEIAKGDSRKDRKGPNKRQKKDAKFGHGGKKRYSKSGDAMSSGDLTGFSSKRMKGKTGGGAAKSRPGKARRAAGAR